MSVGYKLLRRCMFLYCTKPLFEICFHRTEIVHCLMRNQFKVQADSEISDYMLCNTHGN